MKVRPFGSDDVRPPAINSPLSSPFCFTHQAICVMGSLSAEMPLTDMGLSGPLPGSSTFTSCIVLAMILRPSFESQNTKLLSSWTVNTKIPLGCHRALVNRGLRTSRWGTSEFPPNAPGGTSYSKYFCGMFCLNVNITAPSGYPTNILPISRGENDKVITGQSRARGLRCVQRLGTLNGVSVSRSRSYAIISPVQSYQHALITIVPCKKDIGSRAPLWRPINA